MGCLHRRCAGRQVQLARTVIDLHGGARSVTIDLSEATWFKSRRSTSGSDCVEVAHLGYSMVGVRDSKNPADPGARPHSVRVGYLHCRRLVQLASAVTESRVRHHPVERSRIAVSDGVASHLSTTFGVQPDLIAKQPIWTGH
ncbi:DUF397 domain-containing protein [Nocardia vinacea]|uniref:DUF397 domain-containing protein n=1 Tax=Nocardia vinacea TaxID=96468 RepID=UPI0034470543